MSLPYIPTAAPADTQPTSIGSLAHLLKKRNIIADLCTECTKFYLMTLTRLSLVRDLPRHIYRGLESSYSSLVLWAQGYGVADGNLDDLLRKSKMLQSMTLEPLIRISETLRNSTPFLMSQFSSFAELSRLLQTGIHPQLASRMHKTDSYAKYTLFLLINEAKQILSAAQNALHDLENEDAASRLDTLDLLDEDSLEDMVADIKTDTQCLIDLDSMYEDPVNDLESHPAAQCEKHPIFRTWYEKFVNFVHQKFPLAHQDLVQQLGWFLNGRLDMRQHGHNPSSRITLQNLIEEDIYDTLILYFKIWTSHKDIDRTCPLCCESIENIEELFETHLPQHAEEIYLLAYYPGHDQPNENNPIDLTATETSSTKLLADGLFQTSEVDKASAYTKQDLMLHDRDIGDSNSELGTIKPSDTSVHIKTENVPTPWFRKVPVCVRCRSRKIRCDQSLPQCQACAKANAECERSFSKQNEAPRSLIFCTLCSDHPEGFRAEYELRRHLEHAHSLTSKVWMCVDVSPDKSFLANCKPCRNGRKYVNMYNAAAHLRRVHFNKTQTGRAGKGGGNYPPMDVLKAWLKEVEEKSVPDTDAGHSSEDEAALSTNLFDQFFFAPQEHDMFSYIYRERDEGKLLSEKAHRAI